MTEETGIEDENVDEAISSRVTVPSDVESSSGAELDPDDERIVGLLALGYTHARAGAELGISARTVARRLRNPDFKARVNERKRDLYAESWERLLGLRERATDVFADSLQLG